MLMQLSQDLADDLATLAPQLSLQALQERLLIERPRLRKID
jgi:hypothetical protein